MPGNGSISAKASSLRRLATTTKAARSNRRRAKPNSLRRSERGGTGGRDHSAPPLNSDAARVVDLVGQDRGPHPDLVPGGEERVLHSLAVHPAAVPALQVDEHEAVGAAVDAGMEGGDLRVGDGDVVIAVAAEGVAVADERK